MYNPLDTVRRFRSRIGKPIRPIIELQKGGSIVNVITTTVQTENMINDAMKAEAWEIPPGSVASAVYVDGLFKGMGFFAGEEGVVIPIKKEVELYTYKTDPAGNRSRIKTASRFLSRSQPHTRASLANSLMHHYTSVAAH